MKALGVGGERDLGEKLVKYWGRGLGLGLEECLGEGSGKRSGP